jgi:hypothetical protein
MYGYTNEKGRPTLAATHLAIRQRTTSTDIPIRIAVSILYYYDYLRQVRVVDCYDVLDPNFTAFNYLVPKNELVREIYLLLVVAD